MNSSFVWERALIPVLPWRITGYLERHSHAHFWFVPAAFRPTIPAFPLVFSFDNKHSTAPRPRPRDCHPFTGTLNPRFLNWGPSLLCISTWPSEAAGHRAPKPTVLSCAAQPAWSAQLPAQPCQNHLHPGWKEQPDGSGFSFYPW